MVRSRHDTATLDLLSWQAPKVAVRFEEEEVRAASIGGRYCRAMKLALEKCDMSRAEVAAKMSSYLGEEVTENVLNRYISETAAHTINIHRFEALIDAAGAEELIGVLAKRFGLAVVPERYLDLIEAVMLDERAAELAERSSLKKRQFKSGGRS